MGQTSDRTIGHYIQFLQRRFANERKKSYQPCSRSAAMNMVSATGCSDHVTVCMTVAVNNDRRGG